MNEVMNTSGSNEVIVELRDMMERLMMLNIKSNTKIDAIDNKVNAVEKRMNNFENNSEVTTQQKNNIRRAVNKQVCKVLGIPEKKDERSFNDKITIHKYSQIFHQRLYTEVSHKGHLSQPYETTIQQNYIQAIMDIEAWTPSNGIAALKQEADENANAREIARRI